MTKAWKFYTQVMETMRKYRDCLIDLKEAAHQIEESYLWVYGQPKTIKQLVCHFDAREIRIFFWMAARNS